MQSVETATCKAPPPLAHRRGVTTQPIGYLSARLSISRVQHDAAAQRQSLSALWAPGPPLEHLPLLLTKHHLDTLRHDCLLSSSMTQGFAATCSRSCALTIQDTRRYPPCCHSATAHTRRRHSS